MSTKAAQQVWSLVATDDVTSVTRVDFVKMLQLLGHNPTKVRGVAFFA
jgi:hypothetical protein